MNLPQKLQHSRYVADGFHIMTSQQKRYVKDWGTEWPFRCLDIIAGSLDKFGQS